MFETWQILNPENVVELSAPAIFFAFFFATFITEDGACLAAGVLAGQGRISFALGLSSCMAGIFVGDILLYWTGRFFGNGIVESRLFKRFVSKRSLSEASEWLDKRGAAAVFFSRFVPGLRLPTYLAAGFLRINFFKFTCYFFLAAVIWTPILVGSAAYASGAFFSGRFVTGIVVLFVLLKLALHFRTWKNRRLFVGRIKRAANWEFWPIRVFYLPVAAYILYLGLRYRSFTLFTCANTSMPSGGFVGESKNDIYDGLSKSKHAMPFLLKHLLLNSKQSDDENIQKAKAFISDASLSYPVVLKPDAGERGSGVRIIRDEAGLESSIYESKGNLILQEYFDGEEASVFYYRFPANANGEIFSITEKKFPKLTGDGRSDLETLILRDHRAVCLAKSYFAHNRRRLRWVPRHGEEVQIINIGTHSMGAIFLDGEWLRSDLLFEKIDNIARGFNGFYFGRFDIRTRSFDDLRKGINFRIVELNGVTSESTNIYDPKFALFDAYRILFRQWETAFEIGLQNRKLGASPTSLRDLAKAYFSVSSSEPS